MLGALSLLIAFSSAPAAAAAPKAAGGATAGATCNNPRPMTLPTVLNGPANVCLSTSGTIESSLKAVADRGLKVKISEMDVSMKSAYTSFTADAALRQQQRYRDIIAAYLRAGITDWGVWDADSWINQPGSSDWPLLFDANFQPKPALQGFKDALLGN